MFIFARCLRSSAAVTPAKYELDIMQVTTVVIIRKKWENNGTEKIGLVTPTPGGHVKIQFIEASPHYYIISKRKWFIYYMVYKSLVVQVMAWCLSGTKPLSEPMMTEINDAIFYQVTVRYRANYLAYNFDGFMQYILVSRDNHSWYQYLATTSHIIWGVWAGC